MENSRSLRFPRNVWAACMSVVPNHVPASGPKPDAGYSGGSWSLVCGRRSERGNWKHWQHSHFDAKEFWPTVSATLPKSGSVWLLVPNLSEFFLLSEAYKQLGGGCLWIPGIHEPRFTGEEMPPQLYKLKPGYVAFGGATEVFCGRCWDISFNVVGVGNYWPKSLSELLAKCSTPGNVAASVQTPAGRYLGHAHSIASDLWTWYTGLMDAWRTSGLGSWRHSASQLSHSAGKRVYGAEVFKPTDRPEIRLLERDACYGGRAEVFDTSLIVDPSIAHGEIPKAVRANNPTVRESSIYRIDLRAFYPAILSEWPVPRMLARVFNGPARVDDILQHDGVCQLARVLIDDPHCSFPCRVQYLGDSVVSRNQVWPAPRYATPRERTIFPTGQYWTTLAGMELQHAAASGRVREVHNLTTYFMTESVQGYVKSLLLRRWRAERDGAASLADVYKLSANSFLGKFAACNPRWVAAPDESPVDAFSTWAKFDGDTRSFQKFRSIGWLVQRAERQRDNPRSHPIMWACVTARARHILRGLIDVAGESEVFQCDTDGMYMSFTGLTRLRAFHSDAFGDRPGQLRVVSQSHTARFWGPKHYWTSADGWTLAGIPDGFTLPDGSPNVAWKSEARVPVLNSEGTGRVRIRRLRVELAECTGRVRLNEASGQTSPWKLPSDRYKV